MKSIALTNTAKRTLDIVLSLALLLILAMPMLLISSVIRLTSSGPIFYWSERIGKDNEIFQMPKFRTMRKDTPTMATHLMRNPEDYVTPIGNFLRRTSLDELPQLWSILVGKMSFVGPRPALFNQYDLIQLRTEYGVNKLVPGLTGWAQINGRDELAIQDKVRFDREYLRQRSFLLDCKILFLTFVLVIKRQSVLH